MYKEKKYKNSKIYLNLYKSNTVLKNICYKDYICCLTLKKV